MSAVQETIRVAAVGKFGVMVGDAWYNTKAPVVPTSFRKGESYNVMTLTNDKGKKAILEVLGERSNPVAASTVNTTIPKKEWKERDFDAEARGKTLCVLTEAALVSPAVATLISDKASLLATVREIRDELFKDIFPK